MTYEKQNELIEQMYIQGATRREIAEATGLSDAKVQYRLYVTLQLQNKYPRRNYIPSPGAIDRNVINRIITLTSWGYREKEIAEDQGITPTVVRQVIEENLHRIVKKV